MPASIERPQRFWSVEKIFSFVASTSMPCLRANSSSSERVHFHSRTGAMISEVRGEGLEGHVEADLIVSLAGAAVGNRHGAVLLGNLDHQLRDQGAAERRGERVLALIQGAGHQGGEGEVIDEKVADVLGDRLDGAGAEGLVADCLDVLPLAEVAGVGDDVEPIGLVDPFDGHRRIQAAAVGQYHLVACHD